MDLDKYFEGRVQEIHKKLVLMRQVYKDVAKLEGLKNSQYTNAYYSGKSRGYQEAAALLLAKDEDKEEEGDSDGHKDL